MSRGRAQPLHLRIEELAEATGATVRNIRVYQEKGLLPPPTRKGRTAVYGNDHLRRLQEILRLLDRGYTFATINELFTADRLGLSLSDLIEAEDARAFRKAGGRRRRFSREDAEELAGFSFSDEVVEVGEKGGVVTGSGGEEMFLADPHLYTLFRDLMALGLTKEEIDVITLKVFEGQETAASAFDIVLGAVRRSPDMTDSTGARVYEVLADLLPRSGAITRVIFQSVARTRMREALGLPPGE